MNFLERCKRHSPTDWLKHGILASIVILTAMLIGLFVALAWPYNDVRFGSPVSTVQNPVVKQGGVIFVQNPSFCNDNQDTTVERWADLLNADGKVIGSYQMFGVQFFNKGNGLRCQEPAINAFTLPNYIVGVNGTQGYFRIRQVISYKPNPVRTVYIDLLSTQFLVIPEETPNDRPD